MKGGGDGTKGGADDGLVEERDEQRCGKAGEDENDLFLGEKVGLVLQCDFVFGGTRCRCRGGAVVMVVVTIVIASNMLTVV